MPFGENGNEPINVEGCGCEGGCSTSGGGRRLEKRRDENGNPEGERTYTDPDDDPNAKPDTDESAASDSSACSGQEAFQRLFDTWDSRNMLYHVVADYATEAEGGCFFVPDSASNQECSGFVNEFWNDGSRVELCPSPPLNVSLSLHTCTHSSSEVDEMVGMAHGPQFKDIFGLSACDSDFVSFLRKCWCMLFENFDILEWAICVAIGDKEVAAEMKRLLSGEHYVLLTCSQEDPPPALVQTVIDMVWYEHASEVGDWVEAFNTGTRNERLCAVIQGAHVLFHELLHRAGGGADFWVEGPGKDSSDLGIQCNAVWLAQSVVRTGLIMRHIQARRGACCDGPWSAMFYAIPVNGGGGLLCAPTGLEVEEHE